MVKCAIKSCGLRRDNYNHGLTLHRLPRNDSEKKKWIDVIGADNINLNIKNSFICSIHFEESSFNRTLEVIRLRDNSVPSLYLQSPAPTGNKTTQTAPQSSCEQVKVTSGTSPKLNRNKISYPSVEIKLKDHQPTDVDPLSDTPDPLGEANMPKVMQQAKLKEDTYQISIQTNKLNALSTRCRALSKKLKRYRELLRRRDKKMADLQADVHSLQSIITEHDRAGAGDAGEADVPQIQILSSKDGVVNKNCNRQILYIKRDDTRLKPQAGDLCTTDLQEPLFDVTHTDVRPKSPGCVRYTTVIRQKSPAGAIRTSVIRKTSSEIRQKSSDNLHKSLIGVIPTLDARQKFPVDVQRTSDIQPNALVIQIDGKHSAVLQPTSVRLEHATHMETG